MSLYGLLRPVDVSPSIEQAPPYVPCEALSEENSTNATWTKTWVVPSGEIWEILSINGRNNTTGAFRVEMVLQPLGSATQHQLHTSSEAIASIPIEFNAGVAIFAYPGDSIIVVITDPGVGDQKIASLLFRRYYQRAPPAQ